MDGIKWNTVVSSKSLAFEKCMHGSLSHFPGARVQQQQQQVYTVRSSSSSWPRWARVKSICVWPGAEGALNTHNADGVQCGIQRRARDDTVQEEEEDLAGDGTSQAARRPCGNRRCGGEGGVGQGAVGGSGMWYAPNLLRQPRYLFLSVFLICTFFYTSWVSITQAAPLVLP